MAVNMIDRIAIVVIVACGLIEAFIAFACVVCLYRSWRNSRARGEL